jgi:hypothetical protein
MHRSVWSVWKLAPLVELRWRSYSRRLISEAAGITQMRALKQKTQLVDVGA